MFPEHTHITGGDTNRDTDAVAVLQPPVDIQELKFSDHALQQHDRADATVLYVFEQGFVRFVWLIQVLICFFI